MDLLAAINRFACGEAEPDPRLLHRLREFVWRYLANYLSDFADREDAVAEAVTRLWGRSRNVHFESEGAFWAYAAKTARNIAINRRRHELPIDTLAEDVSGEDIAFLDRVAEVSRDRERMYSLADRLWLGTVADPAEARRRLVAAQLFYLHGRRPKEIAGLLVGPGQEAVRTVSAWIADSAVMLALCFNQLYIDNDRLAGLIVDSEDPPSPDIMDDVARVGYVSRWQEWSDDELRILLLRYRNGLLREKILRLSPASSEEEVDQVLVRCASNLPFVSIATKLKERFMAMGIHKEPLGEAGLYRRLVFQYHSADELPHRQILERAGPAAEVGSYHLTPGMLNVWLSNGRLFDQLAVFAAEQGS